MAINPDKFMDAVYAAIADEAIPHLGAFGNGVDRQGQAYIERKLNEYPILIEYLEGRKSVENAFQRYSLFQLIKLANEYEGENIYQEVFYQSELVDSDRTEDASTGVVCLVGGDCLIWDERSKKWMI